MSEALPSRVVALAVGGALVLALASGVLVGARLGAWASRPTAQILAATDPSSELSTTPRGVASPGGFTGFGGPPLLQGEVLQAGMVIGPGSAGRVSVAFEGGSAEVDFAASGRLFRIGPSRRTLATGDQVVIRVDGARALAILRSSVDSAAVATSGAPR